MAWPTPQFSRSQVNKAGKILVESEEEEFSFNNIRQYVWASEVVNNWRSCHGYPINTFQATLRTKVKLFDNTAIVAQRLKRMPSIVQKLSRFRKMQLSRMQDIGGLRAVVSSLGKMRSLEDNYRNSRFNHELVASYDYVNNPKDSGYRSIHLVYRYKNPSVTDYNGLLIELQLRTRLQHTWATAVETMGTFLNYALKSSEGPDEWLDFFTLTGSAFACLEGTPPVPGYDDLDEKRIYKLVRERTRQLDIKEKLHTFSVAADAIYTDKKRGSYYLIVLHPKELRVSISTYTKRSLDLASRRYGEVEQQIAKGEPVQAVLVSTGDLDNLKRAYPNFFLDTHEFINQLDLIDSLK